MKLSQSLYDDLFIESHQKLAIKCVQTLTGIKNFFVSTSREVIEIDDYVIDAQKNHNPHYKKDILMLRINNCNDVLANKLYYDILNRLKCVLGNKLYNKWDNEKKRFKDNIFSLSISEFNF